MKVGLQSIKTVALILLLASMTLLMTGCMETGTYEEGYASKYMSGWSSGIWTLYIDNLDDDDGDIERAEAFNLTVRYMTLNATPDNITFGNITPGYSGNITLNITNIGDWTQEDVTINASAGSCSNYFGDSDSELLCINSLGISTLPLWEYAHLDDVLDSYSGGIDLRNKSSGSLYVYAKNLFDPFFNLTVYIVPTEAPGKTYSIDNFTSTITLDESLYNLHLPGGEGYNIFINSDSPNTTVLVYYFAYQQLATTSIDSLGDMSAGETEELTLQLDVPEENLSYFTSSEGNIILSSTNGGYLGIPFNFTLNMPYLYSSLSYINNIVLSPGESTTAGFMIENLGSLNVTQWNVTCAGDSCDLLDIEIHNGSDIIYVNGSVQYAINISIPSSQALGLYEGAITITAPDAHPSSGREYVFNVYVLDEQLISSFMYVYPPSSSDLQVKSYNLGEEVYVDAYFKSTNITYIKTPDLILNVTDPKDAESTVELSQSLLGYYSYDSLTNLDYIGAYSLNLDWNGNISYCDYKGCWFYDSMQTCNELSSCIWDNNTASCIILDCWDYVTQSTCEMNVECAWDSDWEECDFDGCWAYDTKTTCEQDINCSWDDDYGDCNENSCWDYNTQTECGLHADCMWNYGYCDDWNCAIYDSSESSCEADYRCSWDSLFDWCDDLNCFGYSSQSSCGNQSNCLWIDIDDVSISDSFTINVFDEYTVDFYLPLAIQDMLADEGQLYDSIDGIRWFFDIYNIRDENIWASVPFSAFYFYLNDTNISADEYNGLNLSGVSPGNYVLRLDINDSGNFGTNSMNVTVWDKFNVSSNLSSDNITVGDIFNYTLSIANPMTTSFANITIWLASTCSSYLDMVGDNDISIKDFSIDSGTMVLNWSLKVTDSSFGASCSLQAIIEDPNGAFPGQTVSSSFDINQEDYRFDYLTDMSDQYISLEEKFGVKVFVTNNGKNDVSNVTAIMYSTNGLDVIDGNSYSLLSVNTSQTEALEWGFKASEIGSQNIQISFIDNINPNISTTIDIPINVSDMPLDIDSSISSTDIRELDTFDVYLNVTNLQNVTLSDVNLSFSYDENSLNLTDGVLNKYIYILPGETETLSLTYQALTYGNTQVSFSIENDVVSTNGVINVSVRSLLFCPTDILICQDGSYVLRDPTNNCSFSTCPELQGLTIHSFGEDSDKDSILGNYFGEYEKSARDFEQGGSKDIDSKEREEVDSLQKLGDEEDVKRRERRKAASIASNNDGNNDNNKPVALDLSTTGSVVSEVVVDNEDKSLREVGEKQELLQQNEMLSDEELEVDEVDDSNKYDINNLKKKGFSSIISFLIPMTLLGLLVSFVVHQKYVFNKKEDDLESKEKLDEYVLQSLEKGYDEEVVRSSLISHGWAEKDVDESIARMEKHLEAISF